MVLSSQHLSSLHTAIYEALCNDQKHKLETMQIFLLPCCTFLGQLGSWAEIRVYAGLFYSSFTHLWNLIRIQIVIYTSFYIFLHSRGNQEHISKTMGFPLWFCYTFLASHTDQEQNVMSIPSAQTTFSYMSLVLYLSAVNFNNVNSLLMAWINISFTTRNNFEASSICYCHLVLYFCLLNF